MTKDYYTVEQIAGMLSIHPKTIQRYIREGRLRATKIGKSWRVTRHDLSVFLENDNSEGSGSTSETAHSITASSVIDIIVYGKEDAIHIINTLTGAMNSKPPEYGQSTMHSQYVERENMVRITLWGDIRFMAVVMDMISSLTATQNEEE